MGAVERLDQSKSNSRDEEPLALPSPSDWAAREMRSNVLSYFRILETWKSQDKGDAASET